MMELGTGAAQAAGCLVLGALMLTASVLIWGGCRVTARNNHEDEQTRDVATWFVEGNGEGE